MPKQAPEEKKFSELRSHVEAAANELDLATMFYEVWRIGVEDKSLHDRLGVSYATNAFRIVVTALRREALLGLLRLWDKRSDSLRVDFIAKGACAPAMIAYIAKLRGSKIDANMVRGPSRLGRSSLDAITASVKASLEEKAQLILKIVDKYDRNGSGRPTFDKLMTLRHERLAHHNPKAVSAPDKNATDEEIETFYNDNAELIRLLLSLVKATAYDPGDGAEIYRTYANLFWASVRGERTEGHPQYRLPRTDTA